jgi:hypothetical protein
VNSYYYRREEDSDQKNTVSSSSDSKDKEINFFRKSILTDYRTESLISITQLVSSEGLKFR